MSVLIRRSKLACLAVAMATTAAVGCAHDEGEAATAPTEGPRSPLLGGGTLWPTSGGTHVVPVCWETGLANDNSGNAVNPHTRSDWPTLSATVRDTMRSSWGRVANIEFVWFGDCPSNSSSGNAGYLAINLGGGNNASCASTHVGYSGSSSWTRMRLDPGCTNGVDDYWTDFKGQVMHETGHALGFEHEFDRSDNPRNTGCTVADGNHVNNASTRYGTSFDVPSIMNYSYDQGGPGCALPRPYRLSAWDIIGVQNAYGRRTAGELVALSGGCLDIPLPYVSDENLQVFSCNKGTNQAWRLKSFGSFFGQIYNPAEHGYAGIHSGAGAGEHVAVGEYLSAGYNQSWQTDGYQIRGIGDTCLDVPSGVISAHQSIQIYECHGGNNQLWKIYNDGTIRPVGDTGYCLDVPWGSAVSGNVLQLYPCHGGASQQFSVQDSGEIRFQGLCLDVTYGTPSGGNPIQLYSCKSAGDPSRVNQLWHLTTSMRSWNDSGLCFEAQGGSSAEWTSIVQNPCNGSARQQWDYYFMSFTGF